MLAIDRGPNGESLAIALGIEIVEEPDVAMRRDGLCDGFPGDL